MSSLEEISCLPLDKRLANFLLKNSSSTYHISMNHEKIASHLGTAREVVTRNMNKLAKMGLISVERSYSKILSIEKLRSYIDNE
jgi:CRP/FNR family transcriptional regulator